MLSTENLPLLSVGRENDTWVFDNGRLAEVVGEMPRPAEQRPRVIHFLGNRNKTLALRSLFPNHKFKGDEFGRLRCEADSLQHDSPLLLLDTKPSIQVTESPSVYTTSVPLNWSDASETKLSDILHCRLLFIFSDVVCLFLDDFESIDALCDRLIRWLQVGSASSLDVVTRPHLFLVGSTLTSHDDLVKVAAVSERLAAGLFSTTTTLHLDSRSPSARYLKLRESIIDASWEQQTRKVKHDVSFSAIHLQAFFTQALRHCGENICDPFNFLQAAGHRRKKNMDAHLNRFLSLCRQTRIPYSDSATFMATAMLMDAYPPLMHVFNPFAVYKERYLSTCLAAAKQQLPEVAVDFCADVGRHFSASSRQLSHKTSAEIRAYSMARCPVLWSAMKSNHTCLSCLQRPPEHHFPCGHAICDTCVLIFGQGTPTSEFHFLLDKCLLCGLGSDLIVRIKPPTAGVRILTIDGGGTRGAIPLETVCVLQEILGPLPFRDCFDFVMGTSSGGLIILGLYALLWNPSECSKAFDELSRSVFGTRGLSLSLASLKRLAKSLTADGVYDSKTYEAALQSVFPCEQRLFGPTGLNMAGFRYAVVTSSILDAAPVVLANYNGTTPEDRYHGYEVMRPDTVSDELYVWEAARATSAAPLLFNTFQIGSWGHCQDGGLKNNNPARLAYWESRRIWPSVAAPDAFLSLGTGCEPVQNRRRSSHFRHFLLDGWAIRLFRSCMSNADGELIWDEFLNWFEEEVTEDYFRLNTTLTSPVLIDDVTAMPQLRRSVRLADQASRFNVARALVVKLFFFEVLHEPTYRNGRYCIEGTIRCRSSGDLAARSFESMGIQKVQFETASEVIALYKAPEEDVCTRCRRFQRHVTFGVRNLSDRVYIYLRTDDQTKKKIGGFPQQLDWFLTQQGIGLPFGNADHGIPGRHRCDLCERAQLKRKWKGIPRDVPKRIKQK